MNPMLEKKETIGEFNEDAVRKITSDSFCNLPNEVIAKIFKYLSNEEACALALTNQRMMSIAEWAFDKITVCFPENQVLVEEILKWNESQALVKELRYLEIEENLEG